MKICQLEAYDDLNGIEDLQAAIWQFEPMAIAPRHVFIAAMKSGGLVLGCYDQRDALVGFGLAFRGYRGDGACLYSHLVGVLPSLQSGGLGYEIKMKQREYALENGLPRIVWTFDPLMGKNANLNLRKLGGRVTTFLPNTYGTSAFKLYGDGFPTDRYLLEWELESASRDYSQLFEASPRVLVQDGDQEPRIDENLLERPEGGLRLTCPAGHLELRKREPALARRWQEAFFTCSHKLLNGPYQVIDFRVVGQSGDYLLVPRD